MILPTSDKSDDNKIGAGEELRDNSKIEPSKMITLVVSWAAIADHSLSYT